MDDHQSCSIAPIIPLAGESNVLAKLKGYSSAEDFFHGLGVAYDPAKLSVMRLHVLKRMGEYISGDDLDDLPDRVVVARCRSYLERAYEDFLQSGPLDQRVFKVLKDAVAPPGQTFVALDELE
ncbi:MAG: nitrogenase stabilizing/protective protein NifW [Hyphomicrobiaceae bacterium]|nr:nitrogenase stabilizing/protective protein NifW [Hyphomicrobiaceae bacterium]MCC0006568.1 nitrogenase stabilizing/protective protein NifW [Hyphomicrobiaceae bacterium]